VTKEDCLDLPPLVKQVRQVPMTPEQTKVYTQMKRDYVAFVESKLGDGEPRAVVAQLAVTKALRLLQITSGDCKTEDGSEVSLGRTPRHKELLELLTELTPNHKVIVWACFKENYEAIKSICDEIGVGYSEIHGGTKDKEGEAERFREDAKTRVCIANQGAGGVGINLVEASYAIYFSRNFKSGDDRQSEARNHRGGSEIHRKITRIDLVTPDTIDELVLDALREKKDIANTILDWKL
jgi:SNF2 family DNA or RNA helicase